MFHSFTTRGGSSKGVLAAFATLILAFASHLCLIAARRKLLMLTLILADALSKWRCSWDTWIIRGCCAR